jgi:hypothetical protein
MKSSFPDTPEMASVIIMDPKQAQEISGRDQLWASLRALRPEIDRLAAGEWEPNERQRQLVMLLARIVAAEINFRDRDAGSQGVEPGGDERK